MYGTFGSSGAVQAVNYLSTIIFSFLPPSISGRGRLRLPECTLCALVGFEPCPQLTAAGERWQIGNFHCLWYLDFVLPSHNLVRVSCEFAK